MKKIDELILHNFKFFTDTENVLKIGKKHLLIWGENGSGKSSIYWAIYTILQCSYKDDDGINAYFTEDGPKNLINIYTPSGAPSFVEIKLDDGSDYKIALNDENVKGVEDVQLSAVSSDFINYGVLASFLSFYHRDDPVLFEMFEEEIFRYLSFAPPAPYTFSFFDNAWEEIQKKLPQNPTGARGTLKYPSSGSEAHNNYTRLVNEFNRQLRELLGLVTIKANEILKNKFNVDIEISLTLREYSFEVTNRNKDFIVTSEPEIFLKIVKYNGLEDVVKKPHSFLNEAKKTAIGLAIRLGILDRRLLADKLNVLALDDLLISLDMSNREVVLKLLFEEYQNKYQLLIFTHDRQFFNIAKNKIENSTFKSDWQFWEFYVNEKDPAVTKPRFFESKTQLAIAFNHLQENDYPAAANYLRKHCEHLIETYLPQYCYALVTKDKPNKNTTLDSMLANSAIFLDRIHQPTAIAKINDLKQYVEMMLNPLSHTERGVERYKGEIKAVIKLLDDLETELRKIKYKKTPIIPLNTDLFLTLIKDANNTYKIQVRLKEDLFVYENAGVVKLSKCLTDSIEYWHYQTGQADVNGQYTFFQNLDIAVSYNNISTHGSINIPLIADWEKLFTKADGTALNTLMVI